MSYRNVMSDLPDYLPIDTLQSDTRKQDRIKQIQTGFFNLEQITDSAKVSGHLKRVITKDETITGGLYAPTAPFNFAVLNRKSGDYKLANFIAYGLKDYNKPLSDNAVDMLDELFSICPITSIDVCHDTTVKPNHHLITGYGRWTSCYDTHYLNKPLLFGIDRIVIYDKAKKDNLTTPLWRIEFRLPLYGVKVKDYQIPVDGIDEVIKIVGVSRSQCVIAT